MRPDEFTSALTEALCERGVPEKIASSQVKKLVATLPQDSVRLIGNYSSKNDLTGMADEIAEKILRHFPDKTDGGSRITADIRPAPEKAASLDDINDALDRAFEDDDAPAVKEAAPDDDIELIFSRPRVEPEEEEPDEDLIPFAAASTPSDLPEPIVRSSEQVAPPPSDDGETALAFTPPRKQIVPRQPQNAPQPEMTKTYVPQRNIPRTGAQVHTHDRTAAQKSARHDIPDDEKTIVIRSDDDMTGITYVFEDDDISKYAPGENMFAGMPADPTAYEDEKNPARPEKAPKKQPGLPPIPEINETPEGKRKFITTAVCLSPFIAVAFALYFVLWGALIIAEGAIIAGLIVSLLAVAAIGTLASIAGIIYGVVKLSTQRGEGIFEIGLGVLVAGATLLSGVLIYNFALRLMPWVIKKTAFLCRLCTRRIHIAIINFRGRLSEK